jgi:hypothetical protein
LYGQHAGKLRTIRWTHASKLWTSCNARRGGPLVNHREGRPPTARVHVKRPPGPEVAVRQVFPSAAPQTRRDILPRHPRATLVSAGGVGVFRACEPAGANALQQAATLADLFDAAFVAEELDDLSTSAAAVDRSESATTIPAEVDRAGRREPRGHPLRADVRVARARLVVSERDRDLPPRSTQSSPPQTLS